MKTYGGVDLQLRAFLISVLDGGECSASRPCRFTPGRRAHVTHWTEGIGPRAGLDAVEERKRPIIAPTGNWTLVIQPVLSVTLIC
jgi:hypothetical protein